MPIRKIEGKKGISYRVYFIYTEDGKKKSYSKSGFKKKTDAKKHEREIISKIEQGKLVYVENKISFNDVFLEYMEIVGQYKYAVSTYKTYMNKFETHIKNVIGESLISSMRFKDIQEFFNGLSNNSRSLNLDIKKIFNVTFNYAIKNDYIEKSPMSMIQVTGYKNVKEKQVISLSELEDLVALLISKDHKRNMFTYYSYAVSLYLGYYLGTRISETLAFEKDDFDFQANEVHINKRLESKDTKNGLYVTDKMKTPCSNAILPLCEPLKGILLEWFKYNPNDLVCCHENGDYIRYELLNRDINKYALKLGFKFNSHMLRYTFSTNLIQNNVSIKTASELSRHSNPTTTLNYYVHTSKEEKQEAIFSVFNQKKVMPKVCQKH